MEHWRYARTSFAEATTPLNAIPPPVDGGPSRRQKLSERIADSLRTALSPRHAPDTIVAVPAIPRTLTGKKLEVPVKRILTGARVTDVAARDALVDPASLEPFADYVQHRPETPRS